MRLFQSVSRHSSEWSRGQNSSRPTMLQLKGVSDTISNWFANHRPQGTQIATVINAAIRSKLESNGLQVDRNRNFFERIFQLLQYSGQHPSFSAHWADLMTKTDSTFPALSLRTVDLVVDFLLHTIKKRHSSQVWQWCDMPKPITILWQRTATNGISSFCIDHRWRQMAFFRVCQDGEGPTFARLVWNKAAFTRTKFNSLFYETNRFHVAVHISSNRSQRTSKCDKNITGTRPSPRVLLFCPCHILRSSVIYYWTDARQHGIYLLNRIYIKSYCTTETSNIYGK